MLPRKLVFVDTETTGMRATYDRIIEIGLLRVEDGKLVSSFESLVNPGDFVPPEITLLTGITADKLENAPYFREIKDQLCEMLDGCILVAHNARFDYAFLKNEFKRVGISFNPKQLCSVKLSKALFPRFRHHHLSALIERFSLSCENRHRAFSDAQAIWEFYQLLLQKFTEKKVSLAIDKILKKPSLPLKLSAKALDTLSDEVGVYIFYGAGGVPLYIGKSINIRDRVWSHFSSDHASSTEMKISQQIESIETISTTSELGALLLESALVKQKQPLYNRMLRHSKKLLALYQTENPECYKSVNIKTVDQIEKEQIEDIIGVFKSKRAVKSFLVAACKEHSLCEKLLGLENTKGGCFGYRLGRCQGACLGKESPLRYNLRFMEAFVKQKVAPWPFSGPVAIVEKNPLEDKQDVVLVDKWCLIDSNQELVFDIDSYKILKKYLSLDKNLKKVKKIIPAESNEYDQLLWPTN